MPSSASNSRSLGTSSEARLRSMFKVEVAIPVMPVCGGPIDGCGKKVNLKHPLLKEAKCDWSHLMPSVHQKIPTSISVHYLHTRCSSSSIPYQVCVKSIDIHDHHHLLDFTPGRRTCRGSRCLPPMALVVILATWKQKPYL